MIPSERSANTKPDEKTRRHEFKANDSRSTSLNGRVEQVRCLSDQAGALQMRHDDTVCDSIHTMTVAGDWGLLLDATSSKNTNTTVDPTKEPHASQNSAKNSQKHTPAPGVQQSAGTSVELVSCR